MPDPEMTRMLGRLRLPARKPGSRKHSTDNNLFNQESLGTEGANI
jgi:hypothetical protein